MTKKELLGVLAERTGLSRVEVEKVFAETFALLAEEVAKGEARVDGFGTFKVAERAERVAKNPRTGEEVRVPARRVVVFKPAAALKERVK